MGKLKHLGGRLASAKPRLKRQTDSHGHSRVVEPWRAWYGTANWKALRWETLVRDRFTCRCGCGVMEPDTARLVADHIVPHRGDPALFWDPANLQTLRADPCHNQVKQREERRTRGA